MKLFKKFITEAKQVGILYHYTTIGNALKITRDNRLNRSFDTDENMDFISFTRDKNFHTVEDRITSGITGLDCRFVVDGDKLTNNYKIKPYDYYKGEYENDELYNEYEERVIGKDIYNFSKYVIALEINEVQLYEWIKDSEGRRITKLLNIDNSEDSILDYLHTRFHTVTLY